MRPSTNTFDTEGKRQPRSRHSALAPFGHSWRVAVLAVSLLLLGVPPAWGDHVFGRYAGTHAQGGTVELAVYSAPVGACEGMPDAACEGARLTFTGLQGKTDLGQDCSPLGIGPTGPPEGPSPLLLPIVNHAFSDTTPPITVSGSFSPSQSASGTLRITDPPRLFPPTPACDSGTVTWTASCSSLTSAACSAPLPPGGASPTFSGSSGKAKVSPTGRVTLRRRIGCPPPGVDCGVSVAATARVPAPAAATRKQVRLGRSAYVVKVGTSAKARFKLTTRGRRLLRRLKRIKAKVDITVTRSTSVTKKTVTVRLKAPSA